MSPRPAPSRRDATALAFLQVGAQMIDSMLSDCPPEDLPARLRSLHYPAPLEWIRIEDVIRQVRETERPVGPKAFWNRWGNKDEYLRDVIIHALLYQDRSPSPNSSPHAVALRETLVDSSLTFSERIRLLARALMADLVHTPRSYLLLHMAPLVARSPWILAPLGQAVGRDGLGWTGFVEEVRVSAGLEWRPGWDSARALLVLQPLVDGLLVRCRVSPDYAEDPEGMASEVFANAAIALFASIFDLTADHRSTPEVLDEGVQRRSARHPPDATAVS